MACQGWRAYGIGSTRCTLLRSAGKDHSSGQAEPIEMNLDDCLEYIADDELVEVRKGLLAVL